VDSAEVAARAGEDAPPQRGVLLAGAGRTVEVEAPDDLDTVAALAMRLWSFTDDPRIVTGVGTSVGFVTETAPTGEATYAPDDDRVRGVPLPGIRRPSS
jgi:hypothetical protein